MKEINRFVAVFRNSRAAQNKTQKQFCQVRIVRVPNTASTIAEYRYIGKRSILSLFGLDWVKGICNLDNEQLYPYETIDLYQGGENVLPCRIYNFAADDPSAKYSPSLEFVSANIKARQMHMQLIETREMLAAAQKRLHDLNFEDRISKTELDKAEHQKKIRSNQLYNDNQVGFGLGGYPR